MSQQTFIRLKDVPERYGLALTTVAHLQKSDPDFPRTVKLGPRCAGLMIEEMEKYLESRKQK
ncbi:AlpA family phage regulatory protein [Microbulbifer sp. CAU 1566]|uniref:helix-turn-helix transcriptional regulator n=1 Tax=Microbulbifer sp. CAU 1566 TaxID=2933269 RepID=UPI00200537E1|nr:AlpA family phage regulatory protein [Microbulbifer sp. CAU 1566]MCK7596906.1 AlpA family phage regulatory protein [Microbulbifer sp. CAU 1566]